MVALPDDALVHTATTHSWVVETIVDASHAFPVSSFFAWYVAQAEEGRVEAVDLLVHMAHWLALYRKVPVTMPVHDASARHCARHCSRVLMVFVLQAVTHSDW